MSVKHEVLDRGSFVIGNGLLTRFWGDALLGDNPLCEDYPLLYNILRHKNILVTDVMTATPLNIQFR